MDFPEIEEKDRTHHTWSKGNPYLAKVMPKPPPLLKPGEQFISVDTDAPQHPDHQAANDVPVHALIRPDDPCRKFYTPWSGGYEPVLTFYADLPSLNPVDHLVGKAHRRATCSDLPVCLQVRRTKKAPVRKKRTKTVKTPQKTCSSTAARSDQCDRPVWKTRSQRKK
uniref:Uncharacterized protein n=1 Tax=viral metagenome TaxID=1070528 RepID=A0A6C0BNC3_9ZZZZ